MYLQGELPKHSPLCLIPFTDVDGIGYAGDGVSFLANLTESTNSAVTQSNGTCHLLVLIDLSYTKYW